MFTHNKIASSKSDRPARPTVPTLLQEQFGGANGELKAAMQYFTQKFGIRPAGRKTRRCTTCSWISPRRSFSHLEIVARYHDASVRSQRRPQAG
ncbi:hypothetical protein GS485_17200 [Rhodococcus hoagii]|nr:hypothetical protein [Prescottella equi]